MSLITRMIDKGKYLVKKITVFLNLFSTVSELVLILTIVYNLFSYSFNGVSCILFMLT